MPRYPEELLRHHSYRDPVFLRLFLEHTDDMILRDARAGLKLARVAPRLALLVAREGRQIEHAEQLVLSHAILGGAHRALGRLDAAESEYEKALMVADSSPISQVVRAELYRRLAVLQTCQKRFTEALALADDSVEACRKHNDLLGLAVATTIRGYVLNEAGRFPEAIPCHGEALQLAGGALRRAGRKKPAAVVRAHRAARINMAHALSESSPEIAATALDYIRGAYRKLRGLRRCRERHHCQWIEGRVWLRLHLERRAEQAYKVARQGFVKLDAPWEIALVSLDLAALYRSWGEWEPLEQLAEDTFDRFCELSGDFESISALSLWLDAVGARQGAQAGIDHARRTLEARMPPN